MTQVFNFEAYEAEQLVHFLNSDAGKKLVARIEQIRDLTRERHLSALESDKPLTDVDVAKVQGRLKGLQDIYILFTQAQAVYEQNMQKKETD